MRDSRESLNDLQEMMYANDRYSLLCIFQAMDAARKSRTNSVQNYRDFEIC